MMDSQSRSLNCHRNAAKASLGMPQTKIELTTQLVVNYLSRNTLAAEELPSLIRTIHRTLDTLGDAPTEAAIERPAPAVPIKRSVTPDHIISLFDGRKMKSMKRYLAARHGMTPDDYRAYWDLPRDYPMVAANYSAARSQLARSSGLGAKARSPQEARPRAKLK